VLERVAVTLRSDSPIVVRCMECKKNYVAKYGAWKVQKNRCPRCAESKAALVNGQEKRRD